MESLLSGAHAPYDVAWLTPMYSLSATFMRNRIVGALRNSGDPEVQRAASAISQNFVFEFPTVVQLASAVAALIDPSSDSMDFQSSRTQYMDELVQKYTLSLPAKRERHQNASDSQITVLLTGSTGNIGSHILAALLGDKRITKVFTLNRPSTANEDRLVTAFQDRNLPVELLSNSKLSSLIGDISQDDFALSPQSYEEVPSFSCYSATRLIPLSSVYFRSSVQSRT